MFVGPCGLPFPQKKKERKKESTGKLKKDIAQNLSVYLWNFHGPINWKKRGKNAVICAYRISESCAGK